MSRKGVWLFWIDAVNAALMLALAGTGVIVKWVLPAGSGGGRAGSRHARDWLGLTRHEWGEVHFWIAVALLSGILLHLAMHWGWVRGATLDQFRRHPPAPGRAGA